MDARATIFVHTYLNEQAPIIINYLTNTAKEYSYIGEIFDSPEKRLFFPKSSTDNLSLLDNIFSKEELLEDFKKRLFTWSPLLTEFNINMSRELIRDFYFRPIKQHPDWVTFISSQKIAIKSRFHLEKNLIRKMQSLEEQLAGAFTFRIIAAFLQQNLDTLIKKASLLAKILNVSTPANTLIVSFEETLDRDIQNQINCALKEKKVSDAFSNCFKYFEDDLLFNSLELAPTLFWKNTQGMLLPIKLKESKSIYKSVALFLFNYLMTANRSLSIHAPSLLKAISPFLDPSLKKKHPGLFPNPLEVKSISDSSLERKDNTSKREHYTKSKSSLFSQSQSSISSSKSPKRLSAPSNITPRGEPSATNIMSRSESDTSLSESTTHYSIEVIRPTRSNSKMRRRSSVVSIFGSQSTNTANQRLASDKPVLPRLDFKK